MGGGRGIRRDSEENILTNPFKSPFVFLAHEPAAFTQLSVSTPRSLSETFYMKVMHCLLAQSHYMGAKKKKVQHPLDVTSCRGVEYSKEGELDTACNRLLVRKKTPAFGVEQLYAVTDFIPAWFLNGKEKEESILGLKRKNKEFL